MCGIAGYYSNKKYSADVIEDQLQALVHRGPDSSAVFRNGIYTAGMRRLSINDLANGDQPLYNQDKTVSMLYNGEIYNYKKLKEELEKKGHTFRTQSDGEVIPHLYEEYGESAFEKLDGMFAVSLWDDKNQKLILARDIPGEKPLYYAKLPENGIVFASEIKAIKKFPGLDLELNYQAIWDLPTFLWIPEPDTIYKNVKALMPGHILTLDKSGIQIKSYKNLFESDLNLENKSEKEIIGEVRRIVEESVKSRLLSDVPVGCFLSGGLDSSIIATIASKNIDNLHTFCVGFEDLDGPFHGPYVGKVDESIYAKQYAKTLGTIHHNIQVTDQLFLDELDEFVRFGDQPWGVSSGLGVLAISKLAQSLGVKVLLTGDGSDESFGGYSWYGHLFNTETNNQKEEMDTSFQDIHISISERLNIINSYPSHLKAWAWHYYASEEDKKRIFNNNLFNGSESSLRWFKKYKKDKIWLPKDYIDQDRAFYMPNEMLKKADRMTMTHSVEGRAPLVAPAILNLATKLPIELLIKDGETKWVLRQAFKHVLPEDTRMRPKHGFNVPIDHWLRNGWSHLLGETFSNDSTLVKMGIIQKNSLETVKNMLQDTKRMHGHTILCYIMLNRWLDMN